MAKKRNKSALRDATLGGHRPTANVKVLLMLILP
jgi:hypothetical protein